MKSITKILLIITLAFPILGCNQQQNQNTATYETESNNWTKDQKETIHMISKSTANANLNPGVRANAQKIAQETLDKCIKDYPDYSDFSTTRKLWYDIYNEIEKKYAK